MQLEKKLEDYCSDLAIFIEKNEIKRKDFESITKKIKIKTIKDYLYSIKKGSKPEQALREHFFSSESEFSNYLFKNIYPEVKLDKGFVDYLIPIEGKEIKLELKPLFENIIEFVNEKKIFKKIKKIKFNWKDHKKQIIKYLEKEADYLILTNLEKWYFFRQPYTSNEEIIYFAKKKLPKLVEEFVEFKDFYSYLRNLEDINRSEPLDNKFFESLKIWVNELEEIEFKVSEKRKIEIIINLINKFIFIQSLDNLWIIPKDFIKRKWLNTEEDWKSKYKYRIIEKFFLEVNKYFYELYDTELFDIGFNRNGIIENIFDQENNINKFYHKFKSILGINKGSTKPINYLGIIDYNFRLIDEDILGKAYEKYLTNIRKEKGIYYTPKYITEFIIDNTVGFNFDILIKEIKQNLEVEDFLICKKLINQFFLKKILDPACGSGSFLIKALRCIWNKYLKLNKLLLEYEIHHKEPNCLKKEIKEIKLIRTNQRELISKLILRHIYGYDIDKNALQIAKLNLWLEGIKLARKDFKYNHLPKDINHILPDLEMNLGNGNSLISLPEKLFLNYIKNNHLNDLKIMFKLRRDYLNNPTNLNSIKKLLEIKKEIKKEIVQQFYKYIENNSILDIKDIDLNISYWILDFWFIFFKNNLEIKSEEDQGFDIIIGNPPYFNIRGKGTGTLIRKLYYDYLKNSEDWKPYFRSQSDVYYYFIIKSIHLLKENGILGFIVENYWLENDYADKLKSFILNNVNILKLLNFKKLKIFDDADNDTIISIFKKTKHSEGKIKYIECKDRSNEFYNYKNNLKVLQLINNNINEENYDDDYIKIFWVNQELLNEKKWILSQVNKLKLLAKLSIEQKNIIPLKKKCLIGQGVVPGRKREFRISKSKEDKSSGGYYINESKKILEVVNNKNKSKYFLEKELIKPLITNSGIKKYYIPKNHEFLIYTVPCQESELNINNYSGIKSYLKVYHSELEDRHDFDSKDGKYPWYGYQRIQNREIFENNQLKIICPYRSNENRFAIDNIGYYGTTDIYAIVPKEKVINIHYILGVLNSKLLTFWYKEAGKSKGNILEFFKTPLEKMPILIISKENKKKIEKYVKDIILFKQLLNKFEKIWIKITQYQCKKWSLKEILNLNKNHENKGDVIKTILNNCNIYPNNNNELIVQYFDSFKLILEKKNILKINGINNFCEYPLLKLKFKTPEFRDIVFLDVNRLLKSKKKISNLSDIFKKSKISVIIPNYWENSINLIKKAYSHFENWLIEENYEFKSITLMDIIKKIYRFEIELNAYIFIYYGFSKEEVKLILASINNIDTESIDIIEKMDFLKN